MHKVNGDYHYALLEGRNGGVCKVCDLEGYTVNQIYTDVGRIDINDCFRCKINPECIYMNDGEPVIKYKDIKFLKNLGSVCNTIK